MQPNVYIINVSRENRHGCDAGSVKLFGIPAGDHHPHLSAGDLLLVRRKSPMSCCVAIWRLMNDDKADIHAALPWPDAVQNGGSIVYKWKQSCEEVVWFRTSFSEGFEHVVGGGYSEKIAGLNPQALRGAIKDITGVLRTYIRILVEEKSGEIPADIIPTLLAHAST